MYYIRLWDLQEISNISFLSRSLYFESYDLGSKNRFKIVKMWFRYNNKYFN